MDTVWRINSILETEEYKLASCEQVKWYRDNPDWDEQDAESDPYIEIIPFETTGWATLASEEGSVYLETGEQLDLDVTGSEYAVGDQVLLSFAPVFGPTESM